MGRTEDTHRSPLFTVLNRLPEPLDKRFWLRQVVLRQLGFFHQRTVFVDEDHAMALFHSDAPVM